MMKMFIYTICLSIILLISCKPNNIEQKQDKSKTEFIYLDGKKFKLKGKDFFPVMLNYVVCFRQIGNEYLLSPIKEYENLYEFEYNSKHLWQAVEDHGGNFFFHFNETVNIYGLHFLILLAALILMYKTLKANEYKIAFYTYIILTYLFFSIVATKMASFTYCISVLIYIGLGGLIYWLLEVIVINKKYLPGKLFSNLFKTFILCILCMYNLNLDEIQFNHSNYKKRGPEFRTLNKTHTLLYKKMGQLLPDNSYVVFNVPQHEAVCIMFYSGFTAYDSPITPEIYKDLKKET